jgi:aminoglycoside phosphotransferase (APT) family kinase protein
MGDRLGVRVQSGLCEHRSISKRIQLDELKARLTKAARREMDPGAIADGLKPLAGGLSSLTYHAWLRLPRQPGRRVVVKVAPPGLPPVRNRDVLRQAAILRALGDVAGVAVPVVLFADAGDPPDVPPFFVMSHVPGDSCEPVTDDGPLPQSELVRSRALEAARMLARLHGVQPATLGLGGEPQVDLTSEVDRWARALDTVPEALRRGHVECAESLRLSVPDAVPATVCHGDWRLGNMLCVAGDIAAVIDWEIWSLADPRVDLAWFLAVSVFDGNLLATRDAPGMPARSELLDTYEAAVGHLVTQLDWFASLVDLKQAATMGLIVKHNRRQPVPDNAVEAQAVLLPMLIEQAARRLEGNKGLR